MAMKNRANKRDRDDHTYRPGQDGIAAIVKRLRL